MEPILINSTKDSMKEGVNYLIKRDFKKHYNLSKKVGSYLLFLTAILVGLIVFITSDAIATIIGIMSYLLIIAWLGYILILVIYEAKRRKILQWRNKTIESIFINNVAHYLQFDEENITISNDKASSIIKWEYYTYYAEDNGTLHIMTDKNIYESMSFSPSEIGIENLIKLRTIAYKKLRQLPVI